LTGKFEKKIQGYKNSLGKKPKNKKEILSISKAAQVKKKTQKSMSLFAMTT